MKKVFTTSAKYYEVFSDNEKRLKREDPFLKETLQQAPGLRVVDMACGTGLHAEFFAKLDASVDAFDISKEMIEHASLHHAHPKINYGTEDMRTLSGGPWDYAVCLGNSLSVISSSEDLNRTFNAVFSSLAPGGIFVLQILNYRADSAQVPRHRIEQKMVGDTEVIAVKNLIPHSGRTFLSLAFYSVSGDSYESLAETAVLKNWTSDEMISAAKTAGFTVEGIFGGYDRSSYSPRDSTDVICVNRKG